jgi:hypothetical protein
LDSYVQLFEQRVADCISSRLETARFSWPSVPAPTGGELFAPTPIGFYALVEFAAEIEGRTNEVYLS